MMFTPSRFKDSSKIRAPESFTARPPFGSPRVRPPSLISLGAVHREHASPSRLAGPRGPLLDTGLRRSEPCDRHHVRRAGYVVHAHAVAELHRRGLAPVLA